MSQMGAQKHRKKFINFAFDERMYYVTRVNGANRKILNVFTVQKICISVLKPGVDVMNTIFCEFGQFSAKNWRFSQKPMLRSIFSKFSFVLSKKRHFFAKFFGENIYKIITSVPVRDS
jgi:hypothetical protein